jgi:hypothetical protein
MELPTRSPQKGHCDGYDGDKRRRSGSSANVALLGAVGVLALCGLAFWYLQAGQQLQPHAQSPSLLQPKNSPQFIELQALFKQSVEAGTATPASVAKMTEYGKCSVKPRLSREFIQHRASSARKVSTEPLYSAS